MKPLLGTYNIKISKFNSLKSMKKISIIIIYLLIAFSYEAPIALTDCEIKNDATTATKAVVLCLASATIANYVFVDDYLKLVGKTDNTKTAKFIKLC